MLIASTVEALLYLAEQGFGIACLPPFAVERQLADGRLVSILEDSVSDVGTLRVLWPASRYLSPKLRVFVDFLAEHLFITRPRRTRTAG